VQLLFRRFFLKGVSWLLLCTSKEVTRSLRERKPFEKDIEEQRQEAEFQLRRNDELKKPPTHLCHHYPNENDKNP
jgi:hypothetical protein